MQMSAVDKFACEIEQLITGIVFLQERQGWEAAPAVWLSPTPYIRPEASI
jgi:hypothetical protein